MADCSDLKGIAQINCFMNKIELINGWMPRCGVRDTMEGPLLKLDSRLDASNKRFRCRG